LKLGDRIATTTIASASLVFAIIIFYTMRNEHHETLNKLAAIKPPTDVSPLTAKIDGLTRSLDTLSAVVAKINQPAGTKIEPPPSRPGYTPVGPIVMPFSGTDPSTYKTAALCPKAGPKTMVMVPTGQSNATNSVAIRSRSEFGARIVNFYQGKCWVAEDPLLGSDSDAGTSWVPLANALLRANDYDQVVIAPFAAGGSGMDRWVTPNDLHQGLAKLISQLIDAGIPPTDVFWVHGEAERSPESIFQENGGAPYREALLDLIATTRSQQIKPRFYVTLTSSCPNPAWRPGFAPNIRQAQLSVISEDNDVFLGPDLDANTDRFDNCHLSEVGRDRFVDEWFKIVEQAAKHPH
jgi:Carbohydrate esterase, sialic acid-specific acetylesterase